jgi:hypothetical protein
VVEIGVPNYLRKKAISSESDLVDPRIPIKKKKGEALTAEDKVHNKALSKQRIFIENVNRRCKVFRVVKEVYRGKHKNYSLTWRLVSALVNLIYDCVI